MSLNNKQKSLC